MQKDVLQAGCSLRWLRVLERIEFRLARRDVNETLGSETETRRRRLIFSPKRDRGQDLPTLCGDREETETEILRGRDRDVFRDVGTLGHLK